MLKRAFTTECKLPKWVCIFFVPPELRYSMHGRTLKRRVTSVLLIELFPKEVESFLFSHNFFFFLLVVSEEVFIHFRTRQSEVGSRR